jgi:peptide/nickel transport system substrate-binding protein
VNGSRSRHLAALLACFLLVTASCGDDDDGGAGSLAPGTGADPAESSATTEPSASSSGASTGQEGGTLIWVHEQEPPDMHVDDPVNNLSITSWIRQSLLEGLYGNTGDIEFFPELLAEEGTVVENADGSATVDYVLRDGLTWSDGEPLTAADIEFTYRAMMAKDGAGEFIYLYPDRTGYDTITDLTVTSDSEFSITWSSFFAGWKSLFDQVYPAHAFSSEPAEAATELNEHLRDWSTPAGDPIPSSGPLVFDSWERGVAMRLTRNDSYHGSNSPDVENRAAAHVDGVTINWFADTDAQINALKSGEAHMIWTQPQVQFEELRGDGDFEVIVNATSSWEHWGFNVHNVHLAKPEVREAMALAMDKPALMADLFTPIYGDALPADGLGNAYWLPGQPQYEDHAGEAGYGQGDIDAARALLESAGYALDGDVFVHPEDGPLSLRVGTTGGNRLRELMQQTLMTTMAEAGIQRSRSTTSRVPTTSTNGRSATRPWAARPAAGPKATATSGTSPSSPGSAAPGPEGRRRSGAPGAATTSTGTPIRSSTTSRRRATRRSTTPSATPATTTLTGTSRLARWIRTVCSCFRSPRSRTSTRSARAP